ncbi:TPA: DUF4145 domain-containing protein [Aeromonas veronii]|nr:DUF4145 domain-containing protein [Aeromonas veronii]
MNETVNRIERKDPALAQGVRQAAASLCTDPSMALSKCRRLLELLLNHIDDAKGYTLAEKIQALTGKVPELVLIHMHFVRKLGNLGAHAGEEADTQSARQSLRSLIAIACWHYQVSSNDNTSASEIVQMMAAKSPIESTPRLNARFFIADAIYRTWAKIAVLTSDGVLYSEYLHYMNRKVFQRAGFDFDQFSSRDFSFGAEEHDHGYQILREVNQEEAEAFQLTQQVNWVASYLTKKA